MWRDSSDAFQGTPRRVRWGLVVLAVLSGMALALRPIVERHTRGEKAPVVGREGQESVSQPTERDEMAGDVEPASGDAPEDAGA